MLLLLYSTVKGAPHVGTLTELIVRMSGSDLPLAAILSIPGVICSCVAVGRKMPKKAIAIVGLVLSATVHVRCIAAVFFR